MAFRTAESAAQFVETLEPDLIAFDSEGKRLSFEVAGEDRRWPGYTLALREEPELQDEQELRDVLVTALVAAGEAERTDELTTPELVERAADRFDVAKAGRLRSSLSRLLAPLRP